ncbi:hypothetical protein U1Q18_044739 [Sarracenia purpurea var. burkii]
MRILRPIGVETLQRGEAGLGHVAKPFASHHVHGHENLQVARRCVTSLLATPAKRRQSQPNSGLQQTGIILVRAISELLDDSEFRDTCFRVPAEEMVSDGVRKHQIAREIMPFAKETLPRFDWLQLPGP